MHEILWRYRMACNRLPKAAACLDNLKGEALPVSCGLAPRPSRWGPSFRARPLIQVVFELFLTFAFSPGPPTHSVY